MATNKKTSELSALPNDANSALFRMAYYGDDYSLTIENLKERITALSIPIPRTINPNASNTINLGSANNISKATVDYVLKRGWRTRGGILQIIINNNTASISESGMALIGQDIFSETDLAGVNFEASILYGSVMLIVSCDSSDTDISYFSYKIDVL